MSKMENFLKVAFEVFEEIGGKQALIEEVFKEDSNFQRQFIKELFTLNKKYFDIVATKMRIEADKEAGTRGIDSSNAGRVTNVFVIKGLYDEKDTKVIDVTTADEGASQVSAAPAQFALKGFSDDE
ncbi:MAG: hypothetical protein A4E65_00253 [Syntrophorhabdus sp. PtaU1.Bin153]|nr:MAG: hypothetical protein A4E65_00253 [Syntrophorhabdus sp. PtaU1.Bin153]